jgi:hypothetical protein
MSGFRYFNNSSWSNAAIRHFNGSTWDTADVKYYDGYSWISALAPVEVFGTSIDLNQSCTFSSMPLCGTGYTTIGSWVYIDPDKTDDNQISGNPLISTVLGQNGNGSICRIIDFNTWNTVGYVNTENMSLPTGWNFITFSCSTSRVVLRCRNINGRFVGTVLDLAISYDDSRTTGQLVTSSATSQSQIAYGFLLSSETLPTEMQLLTQSLASSSQIGCLSFWPLIDGSLNDSIASRTLVSTGASTSTQGLTIALPTIDTSLATVCHQTSPFASSAFYFSGINLSASSSVTVSYWIRLPPGTDSNSYNFVLSDSVDHTTGTVVFMVNQNFGTTSQMKQLNITLGIDGGFIDDYVYSVTDTGNTTIPFAWWFVSWVFTMNGTTTDCTCYWTYEGGPALSQVAFQNIPYDLSSVTTFTAGNAVGDFCNVRVHEGEPKTLSELTTLMTQTTPDTTAWYDCAFRDCDCSDRSGNNRQPVFIKGIPLSGNGRAIPAVLT